MATYTNRVLVLSGGAPLTLAAADVLDMRGVGLSFTESAGENQYTRFAVGASSFDLTMKDSSNVTKFSVASASGNTAIVGTAVITGNVDANDGLDVAGGALTFTGTEGSWTFAEANSALTQTGTGTVTLTGNLDATLGLDVTGGPFVVGANKFTVAVATGDTVIAGNLTVQGTEYIIHSEEVLIADNHLYLNAEYTVAVAQTGGLVINTLPSGTAGKRAAVIATGFTAAVVDPAANAYVYVTTGKTFATADIIQVSGAANPKNDGIYEVLAYNDTTGKLTIRGIGVTARVEDFTESDFATDATVQGDVVVVNLSVLRAGTDGKWETSYAAATPFVFTDIDASVTLQEAYDNSGAQPIILMDDNDAAALSFDSTGKVGILKLVTTDGSEAVSMSGNLGVSGTLGVTLQADFAANVDASFGIDIDADSKSLTIGAGADFGILHDGTDTTMTSATGDLIIDNTLVTGSTIMRLGTDTSATDFQVQNNSAASYFTVDASGVVGLSVAGKATTVAGSMAVTQALTLSSTSSQVVTLVSAGALATTTLTENHATNDGTALSVGITQGATGRTGGALTGLLVTAVSNTADVDYQMNALTLNANTVGGPPGAGANISAIRVGQGFGKLMDLTAMGSGTSKINLADNQSSAFSVAEAASIYMTFVTTDGAEAVNFSKNVGITGNLAQSTGTAVLTTNGNSSFTSSGSLTFTAGGASVWSASVGDLTLQASTNSLILTSAEATADAIRINASNAAGGIDADAGTGGIALDATGASHFTLTGAVDLTLYSTAGSVIVQGGEAAVDAVRIYASNAAGGIDIDAGATSGAIAVNAGGAINLTAGAGSAWGITGTLDLDASGALAINSSAGTISLGNDAVAQNISIGTAGARTIALGNTTNDTAVNITSGAAATITVGSLSAADDLTISVTGTTDSSLVLSSTGTGVDAVKISGVAGNGTGGVDIDSGTGGIAVDSTGAISIDSAAASNFTVTGAFDLTLSSSGGSAIVSGGEAAADAVKIQAGAVGGGIDIDAGTAGIAIDSTGAIALNGAAASNFSVSGAGIDMTIASAAGRSVLQGGEAAVDAVYIVASDGAGGIDVNAGTGGITIDTTGALSLDSAAASNFTVTGAFDLTLYSTAGSVNIQGGEAAVNAIYLNASNAAGGIDVNAGTGGVTIDTTDGGGISIDAIGAPSNFSLASTADADDLTVAVTGTNNSSLVLSSTGTGVDAVKIIGLAAASTGGVDIDSGTGGITIDSTGAVSIDSAAASNFTVTGAFDLTLSSSGGSAIVSGGEAAADAVKIQAGAVGGGIDIDAGTAGIAIDSTGAIALNGAAASNFSVSGAGIDMTIASAAGRSVLQGGEAAVDAVYIVASDGAGGIDVNAGTGGITIDTTGALSLDSAAASNFTVTGAFDLTLYSTAGSVNIQGGEAAVNAIYLNASNAAGGIDVNAGTGGVTIDTTDGGGISIDAIGAPSNFSLASTADADDLTVAVTGTNNSSLVLSSTGTGVDAVKIIGLAAASTGGVDIDSGTGGITIDSTGAVSIDSAAASNFTVTGAFDLTLYSTVGSVNIQGGEAAVNAIYLNASNAAGGVDIDTGTGGFALDTAGGPIALTTGVAGDITLASVESVIVTGSAFTADVTGVIQLDAAGASYFHVTGADLSLYTETSGDVYATAAGALVLTGSGSGVIMQATVGDITLDTQDGGAISIDAIGAPSNITLTATADADDLTIAVAGDFNASLVLTSSGTGVDAVAITATAASGGIDVNAGTNGITVDTTGAISLDSAAASNFTVTGAFDLTLYTTLGSVVVQGGESAADAVRINASGANGGVDIDSLLGGITVDSTGAISLDSTAASNFTVTGAVDLTLSSSAGSVLVQGGEAAVDAVTISSTNAAGGVDINAGTGGLTLDTTDGGAISIDAIGAPSNLTLAATADADDLTIAVTGAYNASLVLSSSGTGADAVQVKATAGSMEILAEAGYITTYTATAGETLAAGNIVCIDNAAGSPKAYKAEADHANAPRKNVMGICVVGGSADATVKIMNFFGSKAVLSTDLAALTPGVVLYLDTATAGGVTNVAPSASGSVVFRVGFVYDSTADSIIYQPQYIATNA